MSTDTGIGEQVQGEMTFLAGFPFRAQTLLFGWQEEYLACKNLCRLYPKVLFWNKCRKKSCYALSDMPTSEVELFWSDTAILAGCNATTHSWMTTFSGHNSLMLITYLNLTAMQFISTELYSSTATHCNNSVLSYDQLRAAPVTGWNAVMQCSTNWMANESRTAAKGQSYVNEIFRVTLSFLYTA